MGWKDVNTDEFILYLKHWRSRKEIKEKFNFSVIESWHCVKFFSKLRSIQMVKGLGIRKRRYMYKARAFAVKEATKNIRVKEDKENENIFSNTDNKQTSPNDI